MCSPSMPMGLGTMSVPRMSTGTQARDGVLILYLMLMIVIIIGIGVQRIVRNVLDNKQEIKQNFFLQDFGY